MKASITLSVLVLAIQVGISSVAKAESLDCGGCEAVQAAEVEFRRLPVKQGLAPKSLLDKGNKAVRGLKRNKQNKLTEAQVHELVKLIQSSEPHDFGNVLDGDMDLIKANKRALLAEANRLDHKSRGPVKQAIETAANADSSD